MEAATLRTLHPLPAAAPAPVPTRIDADDYDWVYDDPDLAPFRHRRDARPEVPLSAFL